MRHPPPPEAQRGAQRVCFDGINPQRRREAAEATTATRDGQAGPAWQIQEPSLPGLPGSGSWVGQEAKHPPHGRLEGAAAGVTRREPSPRRRN